MEACTPFCGTPLITCARHYLARLQPKPQFIISARTCTSMKLYISTHTKSHETPCPRHMAKPHATNGRTIITLSPYTLTHTHTHTPAQQQHDITSQADFIYTKSLPNHTECLTARGARRQLGSDTTSEGLKACKAQLPRGRPRWLGHQQQATGN